MLEEQLSLLNEILNTKSPSGCESQIVRLLQKHLAAYCKTETDTIGNLYMFASEQQSGLKIMITAHADEVGFQVTHINNNGFIFFRGVASADLQTIPGSEVTILTKNGEINGVIGKKSPHVIEGKDKDKIPHLEDLWIDCGFSSSEEAGCYVTQGDYITLKSNAQFTINKKRVISKALDNKVSVFVLVEAIKRLTKREVPVCVVGVATTQEEIGCRGSVVAANKIKPDVCICLDVGIATDIPNMNFQQYGRFELGKGVGIIHNADNNEQLVQSLISTAKKEGLIYQETIGYRPTGGTEASSVRLASQGVVTANLSIPNRYMHSSVEMCDLNDIEQTIELLTKEIETLCTISREQFNLYALSD